MKKYASPARRARPKMDTLTPIPAWAPVLRLLLFPDPDPEDEFGLELAEEVEVEVEEEVVEEVDGLVLVVAGPV